MIGFGEEIVKSMPLFGFTNTGKEWFAGNNTDIMGDELEGTH
tara:strand:+ start:179 stop:304 length:126 start_codon:yes stop_codon:yes gene_type:complete